MVMLVIAPDKDWRQLSIYPPLFGLIGYFKILNWVLQVFVLGIQKANKQWKRASFLLIFLLTFGFTFRKHTGNISISEIAISYLFQKTNVSIKSSLILRTTNAVLGLVTIRYYSIALGLFRSRYAIVTVKRDECHNRVNIGYS